MNAPTSPKPVLYLVPTSAGVGLTTVSMGLVRALDRMGVKASFFKPVAQLFRGDTGPERSTYVIRNTTHLNPPTPMPYEQAERLLTSGRADQLMEEMVELFHTAAGDADVIVVEGLINMEQAEHAAELNQALARTLDASVVLVGTPIDEDLDLLDQQMTATALEFGGIHSRRTLGAIINFVNAPRDKNGRLRPDLPGPSEEQALGRTKIQADCTIFKSQQFRMLGCISWEHDLAVSRTSDVAKHLGATVLNEGAMDSRRVHRIFLCARMVDHITHVFTANALLIIPIDRMDLFVAACMAAQNGIPLAGVVLTSATGNLPDARIMKLCQTALETGLPLLTVPTDSYTTATQIPRMNTEIPVDDQERIEMSMNHVASRIDREWVTTLSELRHEPHLSPAAFRYRLVQFARAAKRKIVLPEGEEPRTIEAACTCQRRGIAHCILLGNPEVIRESAARMNVTLPEDIELLDPEPLRGLYVDALVELRRHKGLDRPMAVLQLEDNIILGTMMLQQGHVDGLVSGAVHTTAHTVRPALRIIKSRPDARSVSSIFFMLLPEEVVIYGDCAIHQDPDAETLAEIALQSADSAIAFGIEPKVAMISYSTGDSGQGADVEKVKEATRIAKERRPELLIDGPLQYDAASTKSVAKSKAPNSSVAGEANVFIFPDLNTGNTTYKAVQRSAHVVSIGPMLQGLNQPVNDLSRGALVEDIVYTIALTAIQATQNPAK